jgi:hypothetical protein
MSRVRGFLRRMKASGRVAPGPREDGAMPANAEATIAPSRVTKWREFIDRVLATEGYVVSGSSEEMRTGSSASIWGTDQLFRISGAARYEDALRQWRVWEEISGEKMEPPPRPSARWHYYKFGARALP